MRVAKTKALISCALSAQLICVFVLACAISRFSHNGAHLSRTKAKINYVTFQHIVVSDQPLQPSNLISQLCVLTGWLGIGSKLSS